MQTDLAPIATRSPVCIEVLENIEAALAQALQEATRRIHSSESASQAEATDARDVIFSLAREEAVQHLQGLAALANQAATEMAAEDARLAACENGLRCWLEAAEAMQRKLADWAHRAV